MDPTAPMRWVLNLAPIPLAIVAIVTAAVLFGTERFVAQLGFLELRHHYRPWFGLILLTSGATLSLYGLRAAWSFGRDRVNSCRNHKQRMRTIADLSGTEKSFLQRYVTSDTQSREAEVDDGTANGLVDSGLLFRPSGIMTNPQLFNIQPWAWQVLKEHPDLIGTPADYEQTDRDVSKENERRW